MNFSLGRISYFETPQVRLPGELPASEDGSAWVAEANLRVSDQWQIGLTQHWNPNSKNTEFSALRGYWSLPNGLKLNAGYRYRADFTEQSDISFVLPINSNWRVLGRWNYSLRDNQNLETLLGLEWRSCCMAFRVFGRKYIRSFDSRENVGIFMELELNGLGQIGSKPALFEDNGILAY
jgi:LPS-assembly protein